MRPAHATRDVLLLSASPEACAPRLGALSGHGVAVASDPDRALELLRFRPALVLVDLIHGPGLSPAVVRELNRAPRAARVVALHEGRIDRFIDQVFDLTVDGFCRVDGEAGVDSVVD
jgi:DNA-binding NarL/FixJ family response regulator